MRALILDADKPRLVANHAEPTAGEGCAIVRPTRAAVSHIDIMVARGAIGHRGILGRAFVGVVESVASKGDRDLVGARVVASASTFCRACDLCLAGLREHCRQRRTLGLGGADGCFADRIAMPVECLERIPDSVDDDHAVFAEPLAAAIQVKRRLTIEGRPFITVLGDGMMALLTVQVLARLNATVRLVGGNAQRLEACAKWGIKHRHLDDVGRRSDQDIVVDCTGDPKGLDVAVSLVRPRGKIVLQSPAAAMPSNGLSQLVLNEIDVLGSWRGPVRDAVSVLARGEVDVVSLIAKRMSLDDGPAIIAAAEQAGGGAVLVGY